MNTARRIETGPRKISAGPEPSSIFVEWKKHLEERRRLDGRNQAGAAPGASRVGTAAGLRRAEE